MAKKATRKKTPAKKSEAAVAKIQEKIDASLGQSRSEPPKAFGDEQDADFYDTPDYTGDEPVVSDDDEPIETPVADDTGDDEPDSADTEVTGEEDDPSDDGASAKPSLPAAVLKRAEAVGISADEAESLSFDRLTQMIGFLEKSDRAEATADDADGDEPVAEIPKYELGELDPDLYAPEVVSTLQGIVDHFTGEMQKLAESNAELRKQVGETTEGQKRERLNALFDSLPKTDWDPIFKDPANREQVERQMTVIQAGLKATGQKPISDAEAFDQAINSLHHDHKEKLAQQKKQKQITRRSGQITARPNPMPSSDGMKSGKESFIETAMAAIPGLQK